MFLESTTAPPPRKRRVAEGGPLPPRQCGSGRPTGLRARQRLFTKIIIRFGILFSSHNSYPSPFFQTTTSGPFCHAPHLKFLNRLNQSKCPKSPIIPILRTTKLSLSPWLLKIKSTDIAYIYLWYQCCGLGATYSLHASGSNSLP